MKWISVYDSLPDVDEPVWIYSRDREVVVGWKTERPYESEPEECWYSYLGGDKSRWTYWWRPITECPNPPPIQPPNGVP